MRKVPCVSEPPRGTNTAQLTPTGVVTKVPGVLEPPKGTNTEPTEVTDATKGERAVRQEELKVMKEALKEELQVMKADWKEELKEALKVMKEEVKEELQEELKVMKELKALRQAR